ncbi:MAG: hypothetical protein KDB16_08195 [Acidimicrobiales bacterium]|nr:hypothetical protein [Acidimicrobiales bacterium]
MITDDTDECPSCHRGIEQLKGALRGSSLRERTRVALDEHETARDGAMFTREEIPAESDLDGWIDGEHDWLASVEEMPIWVGGRRSTSGKGIASCSSGSAPDAGPITQPGRLVIRCATPLISLDTTGRPQLQPSTRELAARLGVDEGSIELERRFARPVVIGGWHQASGLPKPRELAAVPGSTFVYHVEGLTDRQCSSLAAHGLGHRTREGFGWIEVNPAPWVAPEPAVVSTPRAAPRLASGALLELPLADRRWVADFIDDRRREVELRREAQPDGPQSVLQTDRVAGFDTRQRVEFEAALRSDDLTALKVLAAQLREAR